MAFTPPSPQQIKEVFPQFTDLVFLKQGGFKAVYRAMRAESVEAFKVVHIPEVAGDEAAEEYRKESLGRVTREIEILGSCQSPTLVKLGSLPPTEMRVGEQVFVAYSEEFLPGADLRKLIKDRVRPEERELRILTIALLQAIRSLWSLPNRVVHRDIKPDNVMKLDSAERPFVLLDLGIAFSVFDTPLTFDAQNRLPPGTYRYLAPEMLQPQFRESLDFRSDIYAAGLTVFEYAAGQHPLARDRDDLVTTLSRVIRESPRPLRELRPDLSPFMTQTVDRMLKKLPALRPANLEMIVTRLEEAP